LPDLEGVRIALLGGDEREVILARTLLRSGAVLVLAGYPELPGLERALRVEGAAPAVRGADVVVAPMSNTDAGGVITRTPDPSARLVLDDEVFAAMKPGAPLLIGVAKPRLRQLAQKYGTRLVEVAEVDEVAILNSIPTAEGAILRAMQELPYTLHGTRALILGFGRCGVTLARMLSGIGAKVRVVARERGQLARAFEMGLETSYLDELGEVIGEAGAVFNTIPALVLTRPVLERLPRDAVVVDIASAPGGTDFAVCCELGIKAFLELGIPGRVAPWTAGEVLAKTVPRLIRELLDEGA